MSFDTLKRILKTNYEVWIKRRAENWKYKQITLDKYAAKNYSSAIKKRKKKAKERVSKLAFEGG